MARLKASRRLGGWLAALGLCVACCVCASGEETVARGVLPVLTTVKQVHSLPAFEAKRHYPVHLRAVVTYYDNFIDPRRGALFIQDATGGVYVSVPHDQGSGTMPEPGSLVEITGFSGPGDFASIVVDAVIHEIKPMTGFPQGRLMGVSRMLSGGEDCRWETVEGIVQSIHKTAHNVTLQLKLQDGTISATTVQQPGLDYAHFVDAKVRLQGVVAPLFNKDRQMTWARLFFPDVRTVTVLEPAPTEAFATAPRSIVSLSRYTASGNLAHRVHVRGTVTLQWPGQMLCVQDATQGVCGLTSQSDAIPVGAQADLLGFVALGGYRPTLEDAVYRPATRPEVAGKPISISAEQALSGDYDAELVRLDGVLIGRDLTAGVATLVLSSGHLIYSVTLPPGDKGTQLNAIPVGASLRLTGLCAVKLDNLKSQQREGTVVTSSFRILLRNAGDVEVLQMPSPWTAGRVLLVLVVVLFVTAAVLVWVLILRRRVQQQTLMILDMAKHDALTGLPTRTLFHERLGAALTEAARVPTRLALLMLDLDNFKLINDSMGHHAGDQVLCTVSGRMRAVVRKKDTIARMGGDEFIILLSDLDEDAEEIAARIVAALSVPMKIAGEDFALSASVGVCRIEEPDVDVDVLLKNVDTAMYAAKASGRNGFQVFSNEMAGASLRLLKVRVGLAHALDRGELTLHYQPLIDLHTGQLTGFEALARWASPDLGAVSPAEFIPVAEESDLIVRIGEWVVSESCREIAALEEQLKRTFTLSVNLSARQFLHCDLPGMVEAALLQHKRQPDRLRVEITESTLVSDSHCAQDALNGLRALGVQLAIDDFGIGFSTLSYITRFAVDWIKIDRSLICDCTTDQNCLAVLRAIVTMAHELGIRVVAEGIERQDQFNLLRDEQCDLAQGFYLSKPVPALDLARMVASFERASWHPMPKVEAPAFHLNTGIAAA